jgi:hypothetical protein
MSHAVTLPATGVDKTDNLPIHITETLHMPVLIMVFILLSSPWKKPNTIKPLQENVLFSLHENLSFKSTNN